MNCLFCEREADPTLGICWVHSIYRRVRVKLYKKITIPHVHKKIRELHQEITILERDLLIAPSDRNFKKMELLVGYMQVLRKRVEGGEST